MGAVAARVSGRPVTALVTGTVVLAALAVSLMHVRAIGLRPRWVHRRFGLGVGENALVQYFGASAISATDVVVRLPTPVWATVTRVETLTEGLRRSTGRFSSVAGALEAEGLPTPPQFLARRYAALGPPGDLPDREAGRVDRIPAAPTTPTGPPPSSSAPTAARCCSGCPGGRDARYHRRAAGHPGDPHRGGRGGPLGWGRRHGAWPARRRRRPT